jgi:signal peptidase I
MKNLLNRLNIKMKWFVIKGNSMYPNLKSGNFVLVNKNAYHKSKIQRGDIVAFKLPNRKVLIKRIRGISGDWLYPTNAENSRLLEKSYFVMGDNKFDSLDSRKIGPIRSSSIIGKVILSFWPPRIM